MANEVTNYKLSDPNLTFKIRRSIDDEYNRQTSNQTGTVIGNNDTLADGELYWDKREKTLYVGDGEKLVRDDDLPHVQKVIYKEDYLPTSEAAADIKTLKGDIWIKLLDDTLVSETYTYTAPTDIGIDDMKEWVQAQSLQTIDDNLEDIVENKIKPELISTTTTIQENLIKYIDSTITSTYIGSIKAATETYTKIATDEITNAKNDAIDDLDAEESNILSRVTEEAVTKAKDVVATTTLSDYALLTLTYTKKQTDDAIDNKISKIASNIVIGSLEVEQQYELEHSGTRPTIWIHVYTDSSTGKVYRVLKIYDESTAAWINITSIYE